MAQFPHFANIPGLGWLTTPELVLKVNGGVLPLASLSTPPGQAWRVQPGDLIISTNEATLANVAEVVTVHQGGAALNPTVFYNFVFNIAGPTGATGPTGPQGLRGLVGATGAPGSSVGYAPTAAQLPGTMAGARQAVIGDAPWAFWPLDSTGFPVADISGNGRNIPATAVFTGPSAVWADPNAIPPTIPASFTFVGPGTMTGILAPSFVPYPWSVEYWYRINEWNGGYANGVQVTYGYGLAASFWIGATPPNPLVYFRNGPSVLSIRPPLPADTSWHHFAWTVDGTTSLLTIYVDGNMIASNLGPITDPTTWGTYSLSVTPVGTNFSPGGSTMSVANAAVWLGTLLSQEQVVNHYNAVVQVPDDGAMFLTGDGGLYVFHSGAYSQLFQAVPQ